MGPIELRIVDRFPEPRYSELVEATFFASRPSFRIEESVLVGLDTCRDRGFSLRIGAFDGDELVGWSFGHQDGFDNFQMQSSGVLEPYRRQGIYTKMLQKIIAEVQPYGFSKICSLHVCTNNAILIPKLKAGFVVTGMRLHASFGVMLELSYCFDEKLDAAYRFRAGEKIRPGLSDEVSAWTQATDTDPDDA